MNVLLSESTLDGRDLDECFKALTRFDDPMHVVVMSGELDLMSRSAAIRACTSHDHRDVIVEMADLTFMDCAGYGALLTSMTMLERRGGSLALMNPTREPLRLLSLIHEGQGSAGFMAHNGSWAPSSLAM